MSDVHEHTLSILKADLPKVERLTGVVEADPAEVRGAVDELRQNFPGLDDLTLAAFASYVALIEYTSAREWGSVEALGGAAAYAAMAVDLAWSIRTAGQ